MQKTKSTAQQSPLWPILYRYSMVMVWLSLAVLLGICAVLGLGYISTINFGIGLFAGFFSIVLPLAVVGLLVMIAARVLYRRYPRVAVTLLSVSQVLIIGWLAFSTVVDFKLAAEWEAGAGHWYTDWDYIVNGVYGAVSAVIMTVSLIRFTSLLRHREL